jgi:hypothetical protein
VSPTILFSASAKLELVGGNRDLCVDSELLQISQGDILWIFIYVDHFA